MGLYNHKHDGKYKAGVFISGFNSENDKNLYISMLHEPENILFGEMSLKRKPFFRKQIILQPDTTAINKISA